METSVNNSTTIFDKNGTNIWHESDDCSLEYLTFNCVTHTVNSSTFCPGDVEIALKITILIMEIFLSFFGNILVMIVLYRNPKLMNIANKFVCNLLVADLLQSVVVMPFVIVSTLHSEWTYNTAWCDAIACFTHIFAFSAVYTIVVVSIDRYLAILHPLSYHSRMTPTTCTNLIVFTWILAILQSTPPLYGWGRFGWQPNRGTCSVLWYETEMSSFSYTVYIGITTFFVPVLIMLRGYWKIFRAAYRQNAIHPVPNTESLHNQNDITANPQKQPFNRRSRSKRRFKRDMKAAKVVFIVMGSFIVSIGPYTLVNLLEAQRSSFGEWTTVVHSVTLVFLFCQCCVHPCIYGYMHRSIRRDLIHLICGAKCKCLLPKPRKDSIMQNNRMSAAYTDEWRTSGATLSHMGLPSQFLNSDLAIRDLSPIASVEEIDHEHDHDRGVMTTKLSNDSNITTITTLDDNLDKNKENIFTISGQVKSKVPPTIHVRFSDT
ncbi:putative G-protein coupled receptor 101 [Glandiceps talaboti]